MILIRVFNSSAVKRNHVTFHCVSVEFRITFEKNDLDLYYDVLLHYKNVL